MSVVLAGAGANLRKLLRLLPCALQLRLGEPVITLRLRAPRAARPPIITFAQISVA